MWKVEKSGEKYQKWRKICKSLKTGKILKNVENFFNAQNEKWKLQLKSVGISGKWKNLLKSIKNEKIW